MSLPHRACVSSGTKDNVPAEDVLRFAYPAFYLPVLRSAFAAYSSQAASGGLKFVAASPEKNKFARPASRRKQSARPLNETPPPVSGRAAGALGEIVTVMSRVDEARRPAVFRRNILTYQVQQRYCSLGTKLCEQLAPLFPDDDSAVEQRLSKPFKGT